MERNEIKTVIDTMNEMDRVRALRGMHQAMILGNLANAIGMVAREALRSAGRALNLVYARSSTPR